MFICSNNSANLPGGIIVPEDKESGPSVKWSKSANNCWYFDKFLSILADILPNMKAKNLIALALSLTFQMNLSMITCICTTCCVSLLSLLLLFTISF